MRSSKPVPVRDAIALDEDILERQLCIREGVPKRRVKSLYPLEPVSRAG